MFQDPLFLLIVASCCAVVIVLLFGLASFTKGGEYNKKNANKFMRWRIILQFVAIVLILAFIFIRKS